jgi:hypothetical protein
VSARRDAKLVEFPEGPHVFDGRALTTPVVLKNATTNRRCRMVEGSDNRILNVETKAPFSYSDACVEKGPTIAFNEESYRQAHAFMQTFLKDLFQLR